MQICRFFSLCKQTATVQLLLLMNNAAFLSSSQVCWFASAEQAFTSTVREHHIVDITYRRML